MAMNDATKRVRYKPVERARAVYVSILQDGSRVYYVRHPLNGKGQRPYEKVGTDLRAAKVRAHEISAPNGRRVTTVGATLAEVAADWKTTRQMRPRSVETFDRILRLHIEPRFGRTKVRDITALEIERFLNGLKRADGRDGELATGTQRLILATLDMVLEHAVKMGALGTVPKLDRKRKPKPGDGGRRIVTQDEELRLLTYCARFRWLEPIIIVALHQALRLGEVAGLQWEDVDFGRGKLRIAGSLGRDGSLGPTKGGRVCTIRLTPKAREALLDLRQEAPDATGFIFRNKLGGQRQLRDIQRAFDKARDRAALTAKEDGRVCFHSLRHTGISRLANHPAIPLIKVQAFARHASLATTMGYFHAIEDESDEGNFADALQGAAANEEV